MKWGNHQRGVFGEKFLVLWGYLGSLGLGWLFGQWAGLGKEACSCWTGLSSCGLLRRGLGVSNPCMGQVIISCASIWIFSFWLPYLSGLNGCSWGFCLGCGCCWRSGWTGALQGAFSCGVLARASPSLLLNRGHRSPELSVTTEIIKSLWGLKLFKLGVGAKGVIRWASSPFYRQLALLWFRLFCGVLSLAIKMLKLC